MGIGICWLANFRFERTNYPSTRTQAAPKVSNISGAIHKKYKTRVEAREAFERARQQGTVRAVPGDPESDTVSSSSDPSVQLPVVQDNRQRFRQQSRTQTMQISRNEPPSERKTVERPASVAPRRATRLQHYLQRKRAAASSTLADIMSPTHAGPSGFAERIDRIVVDADEPRERQNVNQESRNAPVYVYNVERSGSPSSRPVGPSTRGRSDESWQGIQHGQVEELSSPSRAETSHAAMLHREARPMNMAMEMERRLCESPGAALSQSAETSHATHRVSHLPQIDQGVPENRDPARTYGRPLMSSPPAAQIGSADIEHEGSNSLYFLPPGLLANEYLLILTQFIPPGARSLRLEPMASTMKRARRELASRA
jgi:hypothetical protein